MGTSERNASLSSYDLDGLKHCDVQCGERFIYTMDGKAGLCESFTGNNNALVIFDSGEHATIKRHHMISEIKTSLGRSDPPKAKSIEQLRTELKNRLDIAFSKEYCKNISLDKKLDIEVFSKQVSSKVIDRLQNRQLLPLSIKENITSVLCAILIEELGDKQLVSVDEIENILDRNG